MSQSRSIPVALPRQARAGFTTLELLIEQGTGPLILAR